MSATKEQKLAAAAEQQKKDRAFRRNTIIVVAVVIVLVIAAAFINSSYLSTHTTAITIGDTKYSPAEFSYFYKTTLSQTYNTLTQQFGEMASVVLNPNTPLKDQPYSDGQTWHDVIYDTTVRNMQQITVFYDAAQKAGMTLSEAGKLAVEQSVAQTTVQAQQNGLSLDAFLASYIGKGMNEALYRSLLEKYNLAMDYSAAMMDDVTYTEDELAAYYAEHADEYDYYDYYAYSISYTSDLVSGAADPKAAAKDAAAVIAGAADGDAFVANVKAFAGESATSIMSHYVASGISSEYKDWVTDPARQPGDTTVVEGESSAYAVMFVGTDHNDYAAVDMRHILILAEANENGEYTDAALAAAEEEANAVYAQWKLDPTEENFANLANIISEDAGSNNNGGLYSQITKNSMVPEIDSFLFDESNEVGATAVLYGSNGSYVGYHVVYLAGRGEKVCNLMAENAMKSAEYTTRYEAMSAAYSAVEGSGMKFASVG